MYASDIPTSLRSAPIHSGPLSDSQNQRKEPPEDESISEETAGKQGGGAESKIKNMMEEMATAVVDTKEKPLKKRQSKSTQKKKKSEYPIDDYLNQTASGNKNEFFPIPSLSPPPPSPSHKAVRNAEDLLQAAEQFLSNIELDLTVGSRMPSESPPRPEESPSLNSSLSEETNPLLVKRIVNAALGEVEAKVKTQVHHSMKQRLLSAQDTKASTAPGTSMTPGTKENLLAPTDEDCSNLKTVKMPKHPLKQATKDINHDLQQARQNVEHAFALAKQVNRNLRPDGPSRRMHQQTSSIISQQTKINEPPPKYSSATTKNMRISSASLPSSSSSAKLHVITSGSTPPPNSPATLTQYTSQSHIKYVRTARKKVPDLTKNLQREDSQNNIILRNHDQNRDESVSSETTSEVTADTISTTSPVSHAKKSNLKSATAPVDVGVNTSYSLLKDMIDTISDDMPTNDTLIGKKSSKTVKFLLDEQSQDDSRENVKPKADFFKPPSYGDNSTAVDQIAMLSTTVNIGDSDSTAANGKSLTVNDPCAINSTIKINSSFASSKLVIPAKEGSGEEKNKDQMMLQGLADEGTQHVGDNQFVTEIPRKEANISTEEETDMNIEMASFSSLIERILISEVKKVADEARNLRPEPIQVLRTVERVEKSILEVVESLSPTSSRGSSKGKEPSIADIELTPEPTEETVEKLIYYEEELERVYTPPRTPSPVALVATALETTESDVDLSVVDTPPLSPPPPVEENKLIKEPEDSLINEVKTPSATPEKVVKITEASKKTDIYEEAFVAMKTPSTTPISPLREMNPEETLVKIEQLHSVSTPSISVTPRPGESIKDLWTSSSNHAISAAEAMQHSFSFPPDKSKILIPKLNEFLSPAKKKMIDSPKTDSASKEILPSNEVPSPEAIITIIKPSFNDIEPLRSILKELIPEDDLPIGDLAQDLLQENSNPELENLIEQIPPDVKESLQESSNRDPDITTATSISVEPEDEKSLMIDMSHASLSEGEVWFKEMPDLNLLNLDPLSEGEIVVAKLDKAGRVLNSLNNSEIKKLPFISAINSKNLTESWSEGEIRNGLVLLHAYGSVSNSVDDTKSSGEISPMILGSLRSEGEISNAESNSFQLLRLTDKKL